jgi:glycosyltransferase involved in cell wall biosynthesis
MKKSVATIPVSVVIVTRNRAATVAKCLDSLALQTVKPAELIVVDNASTDTTAQVVQAFAKTSQWEVRRVVESRLGYPTVYNRGLAVAKHDWAIFIDDDCVAVPTWLESFWTAIQHLSAKQQKSLAALVGNSETRSPATIWSLAVLAADKFWKHSVILPNQQVWDLETLDNKNIAYFKPFLTKHHCSFNEAALQEPGKGAAEDADLGMQLQSNGGHAFFVPTATIFHQDPNTFVWYYRRLLSGATANFYYHRRWAEFRQQAGLLDKRRQQRFRDFWPQFCQEQNLGGIQQVMVFCIIWLSFKLIHFWQWQWKQQKIS